MLIVNVTIGLRMGTIDNFLITTQREYVLRWNKIIPKVHKSQSRYEYGAQAQSPIHRICLHVECTCAVNKELHTVSRISPFALALSPSVSCFHVMMFLHMVNYTRDDRSNRFHCRFYFSLRCDSPMSCLSEIGIIYLHFLFSPIDTCEASVQCERICCYTFTEENTRRNAPCQCERGCFIIVPLCSVVACVLFRMQRYLLCGLIGVRMHIAHLTMHSHTYLSLIVFRQRGTFPCLCIS